MTAICKAARNDALGTVGRKCSAVESRLKAMKLDFYYTGSGNAKILDMGNRDYAILPSRAMPSM